MVHTPYAVISGLIMNTLQIQIDCIKESNNGHGLIMDLVVKHSTAGNEPVFTETVIHTVHCCLE